MAQIKAKVDGEWVELPIKVIGVGGGEEPTYDDPTIDVSAAGLITASANGKSATQQLSTQAAKTVTPTTSEQTAVASGKYTTGEVKVGAIPSNYIVPSGSQTFTENGTYDVTSLASAIVNVASSGGGLPTGIAAFDFGTITVSSDFTTTQKTCNHNLGVVPDLVIVFKNGSNIATANTMMFSMRCTKMGYRSSAYTLYNCYHGNSTTSVTISNSSSTTAGVSNMTATSFNLASHSATYYWRAGTYSYIAVKFA